MVTTSRILGPDGQPFQMADLREPQTAKIMQLQHEWQGHPSRGLTPSRLASILDGAETGDLVAQAELFEDMEEKDGHIASEMSKRRRALLSLDWDIVPPTSPYPDEKVAAARLKELLQDIPDFEEMLFDATDAIGKGYSCLEIEWHRVEGSWLPNTITHRPQSWFRLHRGYRQEIRLRDASPEGAPLQPFGWITHTHKAKSGYLERSALFRVLVWPYLFKNYSVADLAEFLEIYGIPLRLGKYPPGSSEKEKLSLLRALSSLGHNAAGIIPDGMMVDFRDAATGDPDAFELMIDWCERTVSKVVLGGTLTSQADGKSSTNALGNVHDEVRKDLRNGDARQVASTLTRDLIYPIAALNGLAPRGLRRAPRILFQIRETEDIQVYADALPGLVGMGMRIPRKWAQEKIGIPEPEADEDDLLQPAARSATAEAGDLPLRAAATAQPPPLDPAERMSIRLAGDLAPAVDDWIDKVRALVERAGSLEEIRDGLADLLPDMTLDEYAEAMAQALAAAALAGRYEILQEAAGR